MTATTTAKKWTKADIKRMTSAIDSFFVCNRPLAPAFGAAPGTHDAFVKRITEVLATKRVEIVTGGIRELREMSVTRAKQDRETAEHYRTHPELYGKEDTEKRRASLAEIIERFEKLAVDCEKFVVKSDALLLRIRHEGLPPEVIAYDPTAR